MSNARSDTAAIHGVVADVVRAPEVLEIAVEAALGDRLGGVLVSEPEVGLAAIGFLKRGGGGRSAFVPGFILVPERPSEQVERLPVTERHDRSGRLPPQRRGLGGIKE